VKPIKDIQEKRSGIYFIYNKKKELMYIGKAKNIYQRLNQHISTTFGDRKIQHHYYYANYKLIDDADEREEEETRYINELKPPLNRAKVYTYKTSYYEMTKEDKLEIYWNEIVEERYEKSMENFFL
jgi:DNA polymerase-3 subunit epsilon